MRKGSLMCAMVMLLIAGVWGSAWALTKEEMLALMEDWIGAFNAHDIEEWLSYLTDDAIHDYVPAPTPITGKDENRAFMTKVFQSFPDERLDPQRILASGKIVVMEWISTGTFEGEWMGIPPTGKSGSTDALSLGLMSGYTGYSIPVLDLSRFLPDPGPFRR